MTTMIVIREARCEDCKHIKLQYIGKRKIHSCGNERGKGFNFQVRLKDKVCDDFEF